MAATRPGGRKTPDAIERLYVYWIISTVLLLFAVIVSTVYTRGALYTQAELFNQALAERDARLVGLESAVAQLPSPPASAPAVQPPRVSPGPRPSEARVEEPRAQEEQGRSGPAPQQPAEAGAPVATVPPESEIGAQLDRALATGTVTPFVVADVGAARNVLAVAVRNEPRAAWSGATWSRLAVLARLMSQSSASDTFARHADQAGDALIIYAEVSARALLAAGRPQDALVYAEHFAERTDGSAPALVLLARAYLALDNPAMADDLVTAVDDVGPLADYDRLALARVCLALQRWDQLAEVMSTVPTVPGELEPQRNFLQAVVLIQERDRLVEALGILDYLANRDEPPVPSGADQPPRARPPVPDEYEIGTWRGVALMHGGQIESARRILDEAARLRADRPEAYYWRAMLEIRQDRTDAAHDYLQNALATSAGYAPAWEALGQIALNAGDLGAAQEHFEKAIEANERRASAHFLLAVTYAKASQAQPAAEALKTAFYLDPRYLGTAEQTEVLTRLFSAAELEALAAAATEQPPPDEDEGVAP